MGDAESALPPSKKRTAGRQLSRDNPGLDDEEETSEQEMGTFKKASEEVMATRKIVKVRRQQATSAPSSNPFASIRLVTPVDSNTAASEVHTETEVSVKENPEAVTERPSPKDVDDTNRLDEGTDQKKNDDKPLESKINEENSEPSKENENKAGENVEKSKQTDEGATKDGENAEKSKQTDEGAGKDGENVKKSKQTDEGAGKEEESVDENKNDDKNEGIIDSQKSDGENVEKSKSSASFSSFQQLSSSQNAFTGLAGTGFSGSTFSFGLSQKDGSSTISGSVSSSIFGLKNDSSFSFGLSNNGNSSLSGTSEASACVFSKNEGSGFPAMREVPVETGEENEKAIFTADSVLFEFLDGSWKERGKGEIKVNISTSDAGKARLVMRAKGNYRLILNASLYPDMKLTNMDKRGITFACLNSVDEAKGGLSTFALKFKDAAFVEEFRAAVNEHKGKTAVTLKTPENSPKASDD